MKPVAASALLACSFLAIGCSASRPGASGPPPPEAEDVALNCDIEPAIDWMVEQTPIHYAQSPNEEWRDCSGNFLRLSSRIATLCPGLDLPAPPGITRYVPGGDNKRPGQAAARTTRGLAEWYDDRGLFVPVYYDGVADANDAPPQLVAFRNRIRPGTVLWFSRARPLAANGKVGLYKEGGGAINHMGTVAEVVRDDDGNVFGWTMYHGQNTRKNNEMTDHSWDKRVGNTMTVPQGGYGRQRIVGYSAHLIPEVAVRLAAVE